MRLHIDYQDEPGPTVVADAEEVPRIGEKVGVRHIDGQDSNVFYLDTVVDVRHYLVPTSEIRVMTSQRA